VPKKRPAQEGIAAIVLYDGRAFFPQETYSGQAATKSNDWSYEEEWPLASLDPSSGPNFPSILVLLSLAALSSEPESISPAKQPLQNSRRKFSVPAIKARLAKGRFKIEF
jgi:hypothetical protein